MKTLNINVGTGENAHSYSILFALLLWGGITANAEPVSTLSTVHSPPPGGVAPVNPPSGGMGIDGDLVGNEPMMGTGDWLLPTNSPPPGSGGAVLSPGGVPLDADTTFHVVDAYDNMGNDSIFVGGLKWFDNPNTWASTSGKASSKTDIHNVLLHLASDDAGHIWAVVAADRASTSGDSYIDFEFLQNSLTRDTAGQFVSAGPDGGRTTNDLLLSLAFTEGGKVADFLVWRWQSNGSGAYEYADVTAVLPPNRIFAALNSNTLAVPYGAFGGATYAPNAFAEGAVDLTALMGSLDPCLSIGVKTIMVKTKASASDTAGIEDFAEPIQHHLTIGPSADAGADQTRCAEGATTAFALQGVTHAGLFPITSATWSVVAGTATIDAPGSLATTAHVSAPGATLRLTALQANGCIATDEVHLHVTPLPEVSIAGPAVAPCLGQAIPFSAPAGMDAYAWSISGNGSISGGANEPLVTVTAGNTCNAPFTLSLTVIANGCANSYSRAVLVNDTTPPQLTAPPDAILECPADTGTHSTGVAVATDTCGPVTLSWVDATAPGGCAQGYSITRTWTGTDACGNTASSVQTITVQDTTAPVITCADALTLECPATPVFPPPAASDRCDPSPVVTFVDATTPGDCAQEYSVTRTWTATDACGNAASCSQTITVQDTTAPVIT
ncbi:MAG: hypothetical protein JXQ71_17980, partial [Verrucomicrobia bacterium]|nr:hypothetical protein [Verrucomicrobiota bacterium]